MRIGMTMTSLIRFSIQVSLISSQTPSEHNVTHSHIQTHNYTIQYGQNKREQPIDVNQVQKYDLW